MKHKLENKLCRVVLIAVPIMVFSSCAYRMNKDDQAKQVACMNSYQIEENAADTNVQSVTGASCQNRKLVLEQKSN